MGTVPFPYSERMAAKGIYLGKSPVGTLDPVQGNATAEGASSFVGNIYSKDDMELRDIYYRDAYFNDGIVSNNDEIAFPNLEGIEHEGVTSQLDAFAFFNVTITYITGSGAEATLNGVAVIWQLENGDVYMLPTDEWGGTTSLFDNKTISGININSVVSNIDDNLTFTHGTVSGSEIFCFTRGALILTDNGEVKIEDLQVGDLVVTRDHGLQPIRWIGSRKLRSSELGVLPKLRPIRIKAGALGDGVPSSDLLVSPQHRVLVRSKIARKMFGTDEVLVAAKQLVLLDGIDIATDMQEVEYFHILFDRHEVVISNGAETESLFTGPEALKAVGQAALDEIFTLFPELADPDYVPQPARFLPSGRQARRMGMRHLQNNRPLVSTS
ncbi:Hint domain-containing protein [Paracoccus kondratievae]|uniref:Hint domain-containing protein n=1 Tax=Paracoccus kondratievae TaxID=135740 RepID=A0AAD3RT79_9RHOB|nr:Hint domain-containing protein [Paracoccus kondratievae]GLK63344.1 hypothetical protein GCM10017635_08140 [Paracoccus kondratievae]